ncbi:hypothetical protein SLEP1_g18300 [Rubroshorea leprosula]|uniref:C3H1-type domain-containing protein n=1 Tax=Rubroshorea leprosula TaxID=152421 RepID=A0AAV5J5X4_9ROSI|nr:hypothetical protein SLEP1_g18300 [Rubroshorea leprosula]
MPDMEEELQKRNTDCVYFLASPLTCKKGVECEFRHNEKARLNPRDCWYWLSGNCLNPTCAFRHPPLDAPSPKPAESTASKYQGSTPINKTGTPCYFYYNGYCNKGDRCPFLHGPDGSSTVGKPLKPEVLPSETKSSTGNDTLSAPTETSNKPSATAQKPTMETSVKVKEDFQKSALRNLPQKSISPQISESEFEEAARVKSAPMLQAEDVTQIRSNIYTDQSSEDQMDDHVEPEERLESSPGFDVLVNNKTENLDYEDESEYLLALDGEHREHFLGYDQDVYDAYDHLDNEHIFDNVRRPSDHLGERLDSVFSQKRRKLLPDELLSDVRSGVDLREHLRGRRGIDEHTSNHLSRRHESSRLVGRIQGRPQRHGVPISQRLHGRLASQVEIESLEDNGIFSNGSEQHGWHRHVDSNGSRQHYRERRVAKQQSTSFEVSRKRRSPEPSATFSGPKSLAQIKEEKRRAEEYGTKTMADFDSPKPLSEILKDKGRPQA